MDIRPRTAIGIGEEACRDFQFKQRHGKINWRDIQNLDIDTVISLGDTEKLKGILDNITYGVLERDDLQRFPDSMVLKLFQVAQLGLEYLHDMKNRMETQTKFKDSELIDHSSKYQQLQAKISNQQKLVSKLQHELSHKRKTLGTYEYILKQPTTAAFLEKAMLKENISKCSSCHKVFINASYLAKHIEKRHARPATTPAASSAQSVSSIVNSFQEMMMQQMKIMQEMHAREIEEMKMGFEKKLQEVKQWSKEIEVKKSEMESKMSFADDSTTDSFNEQLVEQHRRELEELKSAELENERKIRERELEFHSLHEENVTLRLDKMKLEKLISEKQMQSMAKPQLTLKKNEIVRGGSETINSDESRHTITDIAKILKDLDLDSAKHITSRPSDSAKSNTSPQQSELKPTNPWSKLEKYAKNRYKHEKSYDSFEEKIDIKQKAPVLEQEVAEEQYSIKIETDMSIHPEVEARYNMLQSKLIALLDSKPRQAILTDKYCNGVGTYFIHDRHTFEIAKHKKLTSIDSKLKGIRTVRSKYFEEINTANLERFRNEPNFVIAWNMIETDMERLYCSVFEYDPLSPLVTPAASINEFDIRLSRSSLELSLANLGRPSLQNKPRLTIQTRSSLDSEYDITNRSVAPIPEALETKSDTQSEDRQKTSEHSSKSSTQNIHPTKKLFENKAIAKSVIQQGLNHLYKYQEMIESDLVISTNGTYRDGTFIDEGSLLHNDIEPLPIEILKKHVIYT
jgi:hypothetical protein